MDYLSHARDIALVWIEDFSLTISDVQLSDNSTCYQITVRVTQDNPFGHDFNWQEESSCISLTVYERPEINRPPDSRVVVDGTSDQVVFTCTAQGYPVPIISWRFNGQSVTNCETFEECGRFQPRPLAIDQATHSITSQLTLSQVGIPDSGNIDCVAEIPVDQRDMNAVQQQDSMKFSRTTLSVLTNNFVLDIGITTGGDMQLRVSLQTAIQDNLQLVVRFRDADAIGPSREVEITLNDNFINTREFEYVIKNEELPYFRFQVQLAMEVNGQMGQFTNQSSIYDTGEPDPLSDMTEPCTVQRDCNCSKDILIIALPAGIALIILAIIFMVVACYFSIRCKQQSHKQKADNLAFQVLKENNPEGINEWHHTVRAATDEVEEGEGGSDAGNASNTSVSSGGDHSPVVHKGVHNTQLEYTDGLRMPPNNQGSES